MATTISFPTLVTVNTIHADEWTADDGVRNTVGFNSSHADIALAGFSSLSIPAGATIDGIEVIVEGNGTFPPGDPEVFVNNGSGNSSNKVFLGGMAKTSILHDPGWGANNDLWGLSWDATTAAAIEVTIDCSTIASGVGFWDFVKVRVTYTEDNGKIILPSGRIVIPQGKVIL
tara:strand:+ start:60 stop:578 length:519 start_codon:yes stop_codon:yes gene_type:complete